MIYSAADESPAGTFTQPGWDKDHPDKKKLVLHLGLDMSVRKRLRKFVLAMLAVVFPAIFAAGQSERTLPTKEKDATGMPVESVGAPSAELSVEKDVANSPAIVIGFVGGFVGHDNMIHSPVQIAAHLRQAHPFGV